MSIKAIEVAVILCFYAQHFHKAALDGRLQSFAVYRRAAGLPVRTPHDHPDSA